MQQFSKDSEIVIVDNSGKNYGMDNVIVNKSGNYPQGLNQGARLATGDYLVFCNPDIIVSRDWLNQLESALDTGYAIAGPMTNFAAGVQGAKIKFPSQVNLFDVKFLIGFCMMMTRKTYDTIGKFDEQFEFENDDIDYSMRAVTAGLPLCVTPHCFVQHVGHQSAITDPNYYSKRCLSLYRFFKKYPEVNFTGHIGWEPKLLQSIAKQYDTKGLKSFEYAIQNR
jgi:GT2 family glycosyltransferase